MMFCIVLNIGLSFSIIFPLYYVDISLKFCLTNNYELKMLAQQKKLLQALINVNRFSSINFQGFQKSLRFGWFTRNIIYDTSKRINCLTS